MNLLEDPVIGVRKVDGEALAMSLPDIFEALTSDQIESFTGVRPHQAHAFHAFMVQLGAMASHAAGSAPASSNEWLSAIRLLSPADLGDAPWLVFGDFDKPAFMQIPDPDAAAWRGHAVAPDSIDVLISTKNHEMKQRAVVSDLVEQWVMALISAQTSIGARGRGSYGIFRMNSGFGSRPCYGIKPAGNLGAHIMRDIRVLLDSRPDTINDYDFSDDGVRLLWLLPWDGKSEIPSRELDPHFIEIARRLRLVKRKDGKIKCLRETSSTTRVAPAIRGLTGDAWTPIVVGDKEGEKALTIAENPFGYDRIVKQLFGAEGVEIPAAMQLRSDDGDDLNIVLRGLVRGQGKTSGYHERLIPISRTVGAGIRRKAGDPVAQAANERSQEAGEVSKKLKFAALALQQNGGDALTWDRKNSASYATGQGDEFSASVDLEFFDDLEAEIAAENEAAAAEIRDAWRLKVVAIAREILNREIQRNPATQVSKYRAAAKARGLFEGGIRKLKAFEHLYAKEATNEPA